MVTLSLNFPMNLYEDLRLVVLGDTILGKNEPWGITAAPIVVLFIVYSVIPYSLGYKWLEGHG